MIPAVIAETPSYTGLRVGAVVALRVTKMFFLDELVREFHIHFLPIFLAEDPAQRDGGILLASRKENHREL